MDGRGWRAAEQQEQKMAPCREDERIRESERGDWRDANPTSEQVSGKQWRTSYTTLHCISTVTPCYTVCTMSIPSTYSLLCKTATL